MINEALDLAAALAAAAGTAEGFEGFVQTESPFRRASEVERSLINSLNSACRVARLHDERNMVTQRSLTEFTGRLQDFLRKSKKKELMVVNAENRVLVNGAIIKMRRRGRTWVNDWLALMEKLGIGALVLRGSWDQRSCTAMLKCFRAVMGGDPEALRARIAEEAKNLVKPPAALGVLSLEEAAEYAEDNAGEDLPPTQRAIFYFSRLHALIEGCLASVRIGRSPDFQIRHVRSTLMRIIENLRTGLFEIRLLALTGLPHNRAEPEASHLVNAAILSMAMGRLLGLRRGHLIDLGFAACYHDLGRGLLGTQALFQHGGRELSQSEAPTLWGTGCNLRGRGFGSGGLLRITVAQEVDHVTNANTAGLRKPHVFSKIVALASVFDRLCNGMPWAAPLSPAQALNTLEGDSRFPADVYKLLHDVLGPRPRGTVLRFPSGEVGVVIDGGARRRGVCVVRVFQRNGVEATRQTLREVAPNEGQALNGTEVQMNWARALLK